MKTRNMLDFEPTRSLLYVDCASEDYRVKLENFLYKTHIPESISMFQPYVSKYAFYSALPAPEGSERFGVQRMQLTEHYWMCCPDNEKFFPHHKALSETFPPEVMVWQGFIPSLEALNQPMETDDLRQDSDSQGGMKPLVFAFVPVWWEEDFKGAGRTISDGPNYRWQFAISYPDDAKEAGDEWLLHEFIPAFVDCDETTRILSSKVIKEASGSPFDRIVEMWFEDPSSWKRAVEKASLKVKKPEWAQTSDFPYVPAIYGIQCVFVSDIARSDNLTQYHGYITMR